jgi:2-dehydro-3-deoxyphosphogluconate aldolase / (4S)-4-hydroxy-2-oxoglutarate aldolase
MTPADTLAALARIKAVPVIRSGRLEHATRAALWLAEAGLSIVEMTLTTPNVFEGIAELRKRPGLIVGAGTILSAADARQAIAAGSQFLVTPCWVDGVIELAKAANIAALIGTGTASEIWRAHTAGAAAIKVFPAAPLGGPAYLKQVRAVFPDVKLMPTGGVTVETATDYLAAGAFCVGLGSELAPQKLLEAGDKAAVVDRARKLLGKLSPPTTIAV